MKTRLATVLLLILFFSVVAEYSLYAVPVVSSVVSSLPSSVSTTATSIPNNVGGAKNFVSSINITGNIRISGNNVTRLAGLNPSAPAKVFLNGSIIVEDNGLLDLEYVTLYFIGGKKPYDHNITLSAKGHPRLQVSNATLLAYVFKNELRVIPSETHPPYTRANVTYGSAIFAYNKSEIRGDALVFYRNKVYAPNSTIGGPVAIKCYDTSFVDLSNSVVESIQVFDNAQVFLHTGTGPSKIKVGSRTLDGGIVFSVRNSSSVSLNGVSFSNLTVSDHASAILRSCTEMPQSSIITDDFATVALLDGTTVGGNIATNGIKGAITFYLPGINASGNSRVSLNASKADSSVNIFPVAYVYDYARLEVLKNCTVTGKVVTYNYSRAFFNFTRGTSAFKNVWLESHDFSSISFANSQVMNTGGVNAPQIDVFGNSSFLLLIHLFRILGFSFSIAVLFISRILLLFRVRLWLMIERAWHLLMAPMLVIRCN